jgi:hypothetical protein
MSQRPRNHPPKLSLNVFPDEIIQYIFQFCTQRHLVGLFLVSRRFCGLALDLVRRSATPKSYSELVTAYKVGDIYSIKRVFRAAHLSRLSIYDIARFEGFLQRTDLVPQWFRDYDRHVNLQKYFAAGLAQAGFHTEKVIIGSTIRERDYIPRYPMAVLAGAIEGRQWNVVKRALAYLRDSEIVGGQKILNKFTQLFINRPTRLSSTYWRILAHAVLRCRQHIPRWRTTTDIVIQVRRASYYVWTREKSIWLALCLKLIKAARSNRNMISMLSAAIDAQNCELFDVLAQFSRQVYKISAAGQYPAIRRNLNHWLKTGGEFIEF